MIKPKHIFPLFCLLALIQIAVPLSMIMRQEDLLRSGQQYRFRTAPVDPYDAFRGRYVALRIEEDSLPKPRGMELRSWQTVYVLLENDPEGYAKITALTKKRPAGNNYIRVKVKRVSANKVYLRMPFTRYYLEEGLAPEAERAYRRRSRGDKRNAYITVRVKSGRAAVEELYVGGKPILAYLQSL